jgi:hypothetical protein
MQEQSRQPQGRGLNQTYTTTAVNHLDLAQFKEEDCSFKADDEIHPVVILIEAAQCTLFVLDHQFINSVIS